MGAVARILGAVVLVLVGLSVPIGILARKPIDPLALFGVLAAVLGLLIARRQPGNRIGLLLTGFGALLVFYENAARYAVADYTVHHATLPLGFPAVLIASELWSGLFLMPPLIVLLFPDGALAPRWRMVARAYLAICALIIAILLANGAWQMRGARIEVQNNGQLVNNPGPSGALGFALLTAFVAVLVFWILFAARQILSWRRATGERRAQLKWLMAGSVATVIGLAGTFVPDPGGRGRLHTGSGGAVQSAAAPGPAPGGSSLQPDQVRRRPDGGRVRGPAERHRGPGFGPR